ncbi:MAG: hypothetical protein NC913_00940 [Candidatus Omnitrophica bacterium]|nr:hypothetical protein [Candidatus Omnitrophota bacterium]
MNSQNQKENFEGINQKDIEILRELACQVSEIARLPVHTQTISQWKRNNDLKPGRPLVWITEIPWHEVEQSGEIKFECENSFARSIEFNLKTLLYVWNHARTDIIIEPVYRIGYVVNDTGFGISPCQEYASHPPSKNTEVISRHFIPQIKDIDDVEKIKFPEISVDWEASKKWAKILDEIIGKYLPVELYGIGSIWFAPWDWLVTIAGVEESLFSLAARPDFAHAMIGRLVDAWLCRLEQWDRLDMKNWAFFHRITVISELALVVLAILLTCLIFRFQRQVSKQNNSGVLLRARSFQRFHQPCTKNLP